MVMLVLTQSKINQNIIYVNCNSKLQQLTKDSQIERDEQKENPLRGLHGVDAVKLCIKQFLRRMVTKQFSWKGIHDVGEYHDFIRRVVNNAFAFWNKSSQHPIMTFHRPFFTGCIGMREVYANAFDNIEI